MKKKKENMCERERELDVESVRRMSFTNKPNLTLVFFPLSKKAVLKIENWNLVWTPFNFICFSLIIEMNRATVTCR